MDFFENSNIIILFLNIAFYTLQQLQASYSFYTWPSSPILAWFLWENRIELPNKHILELGAGTALPSIVAAKCGARVTITGLINSLF